MLPRRFSWLSGFVDLRDDDLVGLDPDLS